LPFEIGTAPSLIKGTAPSLNPVEGDIEGHIERDSLLF